jgi:uncharacterized membrane protein
VDNRDVLHAVAMPRYRLGFLVLATVALAHGLSHCFGSFAKRGHAFASYTVVGFVMAFSVSAYLLWTFGRFDGTELLPTVMESVVLALPASLGAASARLIL